MENKIVSFIDDQELYYFKLMKGHFGAKNNGEALTRILQIAYPVVKKEIKKKA